MYRGFGLRCCAALPIDFFDCEGEGEEEEEVVVFFFDELVVR